MSILSRQIVPIDAVFFDVLHAIGISGINYQGLM